MAVEPLRRLAVKKNNAAAICDVTPEVFQAIVDEGLIKPLDYLGTFAIADIERLVEDLRNQPKQDHVKPEDHSQGEEPKPEVRSSGDPGRTAKELLRLKLG